jgi:hypothetical protein
MSRKHKEACGCIIDASERYVSMCPEHEAEWREVHERWNADYKRIKAEREGNVGVPGIPQVDSAQAGESLSH